MSVDLNEQPVKYPMTNQEVEFTSLISQALCTLLKEYALKMPVPSGKYKLFNVTMDTTKTSNIRFEGSYVMPRPQSLDVGIGHPRQTKIWYFGQWYTYQIQNSGVVVSALRPANLGGSVDSPEMGKFYTSVMSAIGKCYPGKFTTFQVVSGVGKSLAYLTLVDTNKNHNVLASPTWVLKLAIPPNPQLDNLRVL